MAKKKPKAKLRTEAEVQELKARKSRPTDYDPKYIEMFYEYFDKKPYSKDLNTNKIEAEDFPSIAGFAILIGVSRDTLYEWAKVYPDFSDTFKKAKDFQERFLSVNGNKGIINPAFAALTAKNCIDWSDKRELKHTVNEKALTDEELDKLIEAKQGKLE
jgi:hypothetical protein